MDIIKTFEKQFDYKPIIKNKERFKKSKDIFVVGMGGSHIAGEIIKDIFPELKIKIHCDYGLPAEINTKSLLILSSYSGNTEEVLDSLKFALKTKIPLIIISSGGQLLEIAKIKRLPYIELPDKNIPPRMALGYSINAFLKIINKKIDYKITDQEKLGKEISKKIKGTIPLIYSSNKNKSIGYVWKINFNENSKNPAFNNVFPELNHNEIEGLNKKYFSFILIEDDKDHPRIKLRMNIFKKKYKTINLKDNPINLIILSLWTSYYLALLNKVDPINVNKIEELKKQLS
ncbi:MAG: SIS domain-containing protein [Candidatus Paceibacterota bacterium]|jgi:glucose/mannose-6-phosphate isomerase